MVPHPDCLDKANAPITQVRVGKGISKLPIAENALKYPEEPIE
jgi:hypothetical protein